jgi:hypothetical protein
MQFPVLHASAKLALCILMIIDAEFWYAIIFDMTAFV